MASSAVSDATRTKVARSILTRNLAVAPGENVMIEGWTHTLPWAVAIAREARRLRAKPLVIYEDEDAYWDAVDAAGAAELGVLGRHEWAAVRSADVYIHMWGPGDRVRIARLSARSRERLFAWNDRWYDEARKAGLRGARLELGRPYPSLAKLYGVDESTWRDQVVRATLVDPQRLARAAAPLVRALSRGSKLRIRHSNGTDLTLGLAHRPVRAFTARPHIATGGTPYDRLTTIPGGHVALALAETIADGTITANRTNYFEEGTATGGTFHFERGRLSEATFRTGAEHFFNDYRAAGPGRDQPGMLRIGLNPELRNTPQLEDIERGTVMVSVGGNRNLGGRNKARFFGFVLVAGAKVEVDGKALPI